MAQLKTARYLVRRWTAFEWNGDEKARAERELQHETFARMVEGRLIDMVPRFEPRCVSVRVEGAPQLMFELTVEAVGEDDARRRATYRFDRALQTKVRNRLGTPVRLTPPWGQWHVEEVRLPHAVG